MFVHNFDPIAFKIINLNIYWYSLAYLSGFVFSLFYAKHLVRKSFVKVDYGQFENFVSWAVIAVIFGGRLGYVIFYNFDYYNIYPIEILKIWKGGMSFHGGLCGLVVAIYLFSKKNNINFLELSNLVTACSPVGVFLGRIANFINGELIGKPTNSDWGVLYDQSNVPRHPSQLYEAFFEGFIIFCVLLFIIKKNYHKSINIFAIFFILYSIFRFFLEFLREPDEHLGLIIANLSMGQLLSIPMLIIGIALLKKK